MLIEVIHSIDIFPPLYHIISINLPQYYTPRGNSKKKRTLHADDIQQTLLKIKFPPKISPNLIYLIRKASAAKTTTTTK